MRRLACALVVFAGCGPSSYADFRDQLTARWCDRAVRCGLIGASERAGCAPPLGTPALVASAIDISASVNAGRMRFNATSAQDCLDTLSGSSCAPDALALRLTLHCHGLLTAMVPPGRDCYGAGECGGGICQSSGGACPGACHVYPGVGAPCAAGDCDPSVEFCGAATPDATTTTCLLQKQPGDACAADGDCSFGFVCIAAKCAAIPRAAIGQPCGGGAPVCDEGLFCNAGGACAALVGSGQPCELGGCAAGFVCVGGACQAWLDAGKSCAPSGGASGCPASQACTGGVCVVNAVAVGLHGSCAANAPGPCTSGLSCVAPRATCEFAAGLGGRCGNSGDCATGLSCACPPATPTCGQDKKICVDPAGDACAP